MNNHASSSSSSVCVIILPLLFIRDHSFLSTLKHTHTHTLDSLCIIVFILQYKAP